MAIPETCTNVRFWAFPQTCALSGLGLLILFHLYILLEQILLLLLLLLFPVILKSLSLNNQILKTKQNSKIVVEADNQDSKQKKYLSQATDAHLPTHPCLSVCLSTASALYGSGNRVSLRLPTLPFFSPQKWECAALPAFPAIFPRWAVPR